MQQVPLREAPAYPPLSQDLVPCSDPLQILVVDDHVAIRDMFSWALQLWGYHPVCVANGQEALKWMGEGDHLPAVILLDLLMPVMDGARFLACLRARVWWNALIVQPPIILLTVDRGNHESLACTDVFIKPFSLNDLRQKLHSLLFSRK